ncbi:amidohydrolase family protein [Streptomyces sp. 8N616]|uniref:amidohydrolase family protein n=1 Tax=Streptomyces sp. 8N616 TaxID=3457414 RepID=UPI003FD3A10C
MPEKIRIVGLEEHVALPVLLDAWARAGAADPAAGLRRRAVRAGHPERFQALAAIPIPVPEAAVEELERAVRQLGFRGATLYGARGTGWPTHRSSTTSTQPPSDSGALQPATAGLGAAEPEARLSAGSTSGSRALGGRSGRTAGCVRPDPRPPGAPGSGVP